MDATQVIEEVPEAELDFSGHGQPDARQAGSLVMLDITYPLYLGVNVIGRHSPVIERDNERLKKWSEEFEGLPVHGIFLQNPSVSSTHAAIYLERDGLFCFIKDMGSRNRTALSRDGKLMHLHHGDRYAVVSGEEVRLGVLECSIHFHEVGQDTEEKLACEQQVPATTESGSSPTQAGEEEGREQPSTSSQVNGPLGQGSLEGSTSKQEGSVGEFSPLNGKPGLTVRTSRAAPPRLHPPTLQFPLRSSATSRDSSGSSTPVLSRTPSPPSMAPLSPFLNSSTPSVRPAPPGGPRPPASYPIPMAVPMDRLPSLQDGMGSGMSAQRQPSLSDWMASGGNSGSFSSTSSGLFDRAGLPCFPAHGAGELGGSPVVPQLWVKAGWGFGSGTAAASYRSPSFSDEGLLAAPPAPSQASPLQPTLSLNPGTHLEAPSTPSWSAPSTPSMPFSPEGANLEHVPPEHAPAPTWSPEAHAPAPTWSNARIAEKQGLGEGAGEPSDGPTGGPDKLPSQAEMILIAEALSSAHINSLESRSPLDTTPRPVSPRRDRSPAPKRCRSPPSEKTSPVSPGGLPRFTKSKSPRLDMRALAPAVGVAGPGAISRHFAP
eukprot:jgi/Botrbrau1/22345/Bobra.0002s0023.1